MNKKEVSLFLTGVTGRRLCDSFSDFHKWVQERLGRKLLKVSLISDSIHKEIRNSITDAEWHEIADFFIESEEDSEVSEDK